MYLRISIIEGDNIFVPSVTIYDLIIILKIVLRKTENNVLVWYLINKPSNAQFAIILHSVRL
jgi:hypothetical protein